MTAQFSIPALSAGLSLLAWADYYSRLHPVQMDPLVSVSLIAYWVLQSLSVVSMLLGDYFPLSSCTLLPRK